MIDTFRSTDERWPEVVAASDAGCSVAESVDVGGGPDGSGGCQGRCEFAFGAVKDP